MAGSPTKHKLRGWEELSPKDPIRIETDKSSRLSSHPEM